MIKHLRLRNFKRHADTELTFSPDQQLVLISGSNGAGKSSILQAIYWVLYGEVPGVNMDQLVRRGAALEGMEVECEFSVAGVDYQIVRRRDNGSTTAVLHAGGVAIMSGSRQVSAEVARIIGMDSAGFRTAVVAQQKELDALVRKTDAERAAVISRLLRLDVVSRARDSARQRFNDTQRVITAMGEAPAIQILSDQVTEVEANLEGLHAALQDVNEALFDYETELAATETIEIEFVTAQKEAARAEGARAAAVAEVARLSADLLAVTIPDPLPSPERELAETLHDLAEVERMIGAAEQAAEAAENRAVWQSELETAQARLSQIDEELDLLGDPSAVPVRLNALTDAETLRAQTRAGIAEQLTEAIDQRAEARASYSAARSSLSALEQVGATCPTCSQPVSDDHRIELSLTANESMRRAADEGQKLNERISELEDTLTELDELDFAARAEREELMSISKAVASLRNEATELKRRCGTYASQLDRVPAQKIDMDELYARKGRLAIEQTIAAEHATRTAQREQALTLKQTLTDQLTAAEQRAADADVALAAAGVSQDLQAAYEHRQMVKVKKHQEGQLAATLTTDVAVAERDVLSARAAVARAHVEHDRRRDLRQNAEAAALGAKLLSAAGEHLASTVQPALKGTVADLLTQMSNGRFTAIDVDDKYNIRVLDDGTYVRVEELSGGEADLVALAVRLALAQVVVERHGAGGTGFLILDECFGSQDATRREAILTGLRALRRTYGQILMISHVPGLEDAADCVITVEVEHDEDGNRVAAVLNG